MPQQVRARPKNVTDKKYLSGIRLGNDHGDAGIFYVLLEVSGNNVGKFHGRKVRGLDFLDQREGYFPVGSDRDIDGQFRIIPNGDVEDIFGPDTIQLCGR